MSSGGGARADPADGPASGGGGGTRAASRRRRQLRLAGARWTPPGPRVGVALAAVRAGVARDCGRKVRAGRGVVGTSLKRPGPRRSRLVRRSWTAELVPSEGTFSARAAAISFRPARVPCSSGPVFSCTPSAYCELLSATTSLLSGRRLRKELNPIRSHHMIPYGPAYTGTKSIGDSRGIRT